MPRPPNNIHLNSSTRNKSDKELITACLKGEQDSWEILIDRYLALIYSVCLKMGLKAADAEDVVQDVCVIMIDHLAELRDTSKLSSWLILTTKREVWRLQRRRGMTLASELGEGEWEMESGEGINMQKGESPEVAVIELEHQQMVRQAFSLLPERCRKLLDLLYIKDEPPSYNAISEQFSLPLGSIGPTRARCLQTLHKLLVKLGY